METLRLSHDYPLTAAALFARVVRWEDLPEVMRDLATFEGLPDGEIRAGQKFSTNIKLHGRQQSTTWTIEIIHRDDAARVVRSLEHGGPVKRWAHTIQIDDKPGGGSTMHDFIEIDAGELTEIYVAQARGMYEARHAARRKLLESGQAL